MIIFSHIPKTAGTNLKNILRQYFGTKHIDSIKTKRAPFTMRDLSFAKKIFKNPQAITGHNLVNSVENLPLQNARHITVLRDPISRCASHYQDLALRNNLKQSFKEWITEEENQNLSVRIIAGSNDLEKAKYLLKEKFFFVGVAEQFEASLKLFQLLTDEHFPIQNTKMIIAGNYDIKSKLLSDSESLNLLKKHNELDQQLYDYAIQEIFEPTLQYYSAKINSSEILSSKQKSAGEHRRKQSIRWNKLIYRQAIKITSYKSAKSI